MRPEEWKKGLQLDANLADSSRLEGKAKLRPVLGGGYWWVVRQVSQPDTGWVGLIKVFPGGSDGKKSDLPAIQETWVWSLGWEDPLEKGMPIPSNILAWRIPWTEEPGGLQSMGLQRVGHDWMTNTHIHTHTQTHTHGLIRGLKTGVYSE